jgi:general stress protein 26
MEIEHQCNVGMDKLAEPAGIACTGIVTSIGDDGRMFSFPMMPLEMDVIGRIWFSTHRGSADKVADNNVINQTFAKEEDVTLIALSGSAELRRNQSRSDEFWNPIIVPWFEHENAPEPTLLRVDVECAGPRNSSSSSMVRFTADTVSAVAGRELGIGSNASSFNVSYGPAIW